MSTALTRGLSPVRAALTNGAVILAQQTAIAPAVTINAGFRAGCVYEPAGQPGLAFLTGRLIDRGTERRTAYAIAEELDDLGVALRVTNSRHLLTLSCTCLAEDFDAVLAVLSDVARRAVFPETELVKRRADAVTSLRQDEDNPAIRAGNAFSELLYGADHPYGRPARGTVQALESFRREDLVRFYGERFRPTTLSLAIVGNVATDTAIARARLELDDWSGSVPPDAPVPAVKALLSRRETRIEMPGKSQADIAYGFVAVRRLDPRYYACWMMNNILGQYGLGGRLGDNIRERQGMAYYAFSTFDGSLGEGPLMIRAGVDPANVARAIDAIDFEVHRMGTEGPTVEEMEETRRSLIGSIPRLLETNESIAMFLQTSEQFGLGLDFDRRLPEHLNAVTIGQVRAAAAEILDPGRAAIAVAGPALDSR
jgi:zinc protease